MKLNQLTSAAATFSPNLFRSVLSVLECFGLKGDPRRMCHLTSDTLPVGALHPCNATERIPQGRSYGHYG